MSAKAKLGSEEGVASISASATCHLCKRQVPLESMVLGEATGLWYCRPVLTPGALDRCHFLALVRLHVPREKAEDAATVDDPSQTDSDGEAETADVPASAPWPEGTPFCPGHHSHFCPCVAPWLYEYGEHDPAEWETGERATRLATKRSSGERDAA